MNKLPEPCQAETVFSRVDPSSLLPVQHVAVDAIRAELDRLQSAVLQVGAVLVSIAEIERETAFPYRVAQDIDYAALLLQVGELRDEFDARFALILRPWLNRSMKAEAVAQKVREEMTS